MIKKWNRWETMWDSLIKSNTMVVTPEMLSKRFGISRERSRQLLIKMEKIGYAKKSEHPILKKAGARDIIKNPPIYVPYKRPKKKV